MATGRRQGRRPLPRTYRAWVREVDGLRRFLGSLEGYRGAYGDQWVTKMRAHYEARLALLLSRDPPPVKPLRR